MDMVFKPNTNKQTSNQEHNSHSSAEDQPAPAATATYHQLFFSLIQQLKILIQLVKNWLQLQRMTCVIPIMMMRTSPIAEGKKKAASDSDSHKKQSQKGKEKENKKEVGQSSRNRCGICFDFKSVSDMFRGGKCDHPFCTDCIANHVATQIQQNILKVNCPNPNCYVELKPKYLQPILPKEVIDRWECAKYESSIALSQKFYCPFKNCSGLLLNDGDGGNVVTSSECPYCHRLFCVQCKVPWHAEMNCKEFQKSKRSKGDKDLDRKLLELAKSKKWPKCPNPKCSMYVQRRSGCEHMTCRCGCNFCYNCGKKWKFGHLCQK